MNLPAYSEGIYARFQEEEFDWEEGDTECPYTEGTEAFKTWWEGYHDAEPFIAKGYQYAMRRLLGKGGKFEKQPDRDDLTDRDDLPEND